MAVCDCHDLGFLPRFVSQLQSPLVGPLKSSAGVLKICVGAAILEFVAETPKSQQRTIPME